MKENNSTEIKSKALCYDMKDLAELFPIGQNNLYNMVHQEGFPKIVVGRRILIPKSGLEKWLSEAAYKA